LVFLYIFWVVASLSVSTTTIDCLETLLYEMTCHVSSETLDTTM